MKMHVNEEYAREITKRKSKVPVKCLGCEKEIADGERVMVFEFYPRASRGAVSFPERRYLHVPCWQKRQEEAKKAREEHYKWQAVNQCDN